MWLLAQSVLAAVLAVAMPACAQTFVFCSEGSPEGFDPALYTATTTFDASAYAVYDRLTRFTPGTTRIEPGLAESWEVSADGLEYVFHLRRDVRFHANDSFAPSREFNADDVIFSFERQSGVARPWHEYMKGAHYEYFSSMEMARLIRSIDRIDDHTVRFTLEKPEAPFIANLAMPFLSIMSREYADMLERSGRREDLNSRPIGTGPFVFESYQPDARIRYRANRDYWAGPPRIDRLVFAITPDAAVRLQKLRAGECHLMPYPAPADLDGIRRDERLKLQERAGLNIGYLAYNTTVAPFDDVRVRRALNMAIDKAAMIGAVYQGSAMVARNPIPPTIWSHNNAIRDDPYDPEAARALLAETGVTDLTVDIWAMPVQRPYMPNARRAAEMIQSDFARIGVSSRIVTYEWGEYIRRSADPTRKGAVLLGWTGANGDPDNFLSVLLSCASARQGGANRAFWCNEEYSDLVTRARTLSSIEERTRLYEQAQLIFKRDAPWATLAHSTQYVPMAHEVTGFTSSPLGMFSFATVDLGQRPQALK